MVGPGGVVVEQLLVQKYLSRRPKQMLRVRKGTYYVAAVAEVARLVDLTTLVPEQRQR